MPVETTEKIPTTIWLRPETRTRAKAAAVADHRSLSVWVELLIVAALENPGKRKRVVK